MIQIILEILAWIGLDYGDYQHRKRIRKKEKEDGIKRPLQKFFLQPSVKIVFFVLIITCLGSFAFFSYQYRMIYQEKTKKEISNIRNWTEKWYEKFGYYPNDLNEIIGNSPMRKNWNKDAWGRECNFAVINNGTAFIIVSSGKDGQFGTKDDISSE
ncbi:type II secretion system protein GspG [Seonamhaeicola maritimus]|uniref:type II secretion system protein GspG n=1 Tax=Seonamhaeicola maritimus TaxID=2591822 RepID=UPI0024951A47|nr:type II secretion system protein GspG [Seonamhaeicola maritimus]